MRKYLLLSFLTVFFGILSAQKLALVKTKNKIGFIGEYGQYLIEPQYSDAKDFSEGLAAIKKGNFWGFINKEGIPEEMLIL